MNTFKKWGLYGFVLVSLVTLSGCGQVTSLTSGADESTKAVTTSHVLSSHNNEWTLEGGTLSYTNKSGAALNLTFSKTPLSGHIRYTSPEVSAPQEIELGILSSLATYTLADGETQQWDIDALPEGATNVVLTLYLLVDGQPTTQEIQLNTPR